MSAYKIVFFLYDSFNGVLFWQSCKNLLLSIYTRFYHNFFFYRIGIYVAFFILRLSCIYIYESSARQTRASVASNWILERRWIDTRLVYKKVQSSINQ